MPVYSQPWAPGTPAWIELTTSNIDAAKAFYTGMFGWEYQEDGGSVTACLSGDTVAAISPATGTDGPPPGWTTYIAVDDAAAVAERVTAAGGSVVTPVVKIGSHGSKAIVADPGGAVFGLWQSDERVGVERYNEPGSLFWNEARVVDYEAGKSFYADIFDYRYTEIGDKGTELSMYTLGDTAHNVGGIGPVGALGERAAAHWRTCFFVTDVDHACAKAKELGGAVAEDSWAVLESVMAGLSGPGGETFLVGSRPSVHDYATSNTASPDSA